MRRGADGTEMPATLRLLANMLDTVELFFAEEGCPFTEAQQVSVARARAHVAEQSRLLAGVR